MLALRYYRKGDTIEVLRFNKAGKATMAKPCKHCQRALIKAGVTKIRYTDWFGNFQTLKLK